ncbi:MAG: hypothetical protein FJ356_00825 [Thaumarchaeota archaeon]|nr:hypothetical protein [Nitrososphaerota archaeon]
MFLFVTFFSWFVQAEEQIIKKVLVNVRNDPGQPQVDSACLVRDAEGGTGWIGRTDHNGNVEISVPQSMRMVIVSCYSVDGSSHGVVTEKLNENETTVIRVIISPLKR